MSSTAAAATRAPIRPKVVLPWLDRAGRLSWLKLACFLCVIAPGLYVAAKLQLGLMGPKPVTAAIHETGDWAVRILVASLAVTPLRRIANWPQLILVRRMLGVAALAYAVIHLCLYVVDQGYDLRRVASEIVLRVYLTIGFVALLGFTALGVTSTDAMIRRLGRTWQRLHQAVYVLVALALLHFFMQTKLEISQALLYTGLFLLLMGHRAMHAAGVPTNPLTLLGLAAASGVATALLEAAWYKVATGVPVGFLDILAQNLEFYEIRSPWWVAGSGVALAAVNLVRVTLAKGKPARGKPAKGRPSQGTSAKPVDQMTLASRSARPAATRS